MNSFLQSLKNLGTVRLTAIAGGGVAVLAFVIYMVARMSSPPMELLYGGLELQDANQIVNKLQAEKVPYELRREGSEVWVPKDRKLDLRVKMAEQQLPSGGSISTGYEIFDKGDMLGSTSFMQNVNLVRAMEGELARTIHAIDHVKSARVHLVLPKREVFSRETQDPSASIVLKMDGANRLSKPQVKAIQHLVAAAVPKLKPGRISIVDDKGTLLARGGDDDRQSAAENADELKLATEQRLQRTIEDLLERSIGPDRVRAEVSVELDLDRIATTQETYDPDSKVVRSQVTVEEDDQTQDAESSSVSVQQNLPDAGANNAGAKSLSKQKRNQETINYEISKVTKNQVKELGAIKRITAAVLVDGRYGPPAEGQKKLTFQARTDKEMDQLSNLVRNAIGYDANRGDQVEVTNMAFAGHDEPEPDGSENKLFGFDRDFLEKVASNLGLSVVAILFLLLVLRPLVSRAVESMAAQGMTDQRLLTEGAGPPLLGPAAMPPAPAAGMLPDEMEAVDELIDIDKVEGRVKASSIRKIGEIVEKHPEEALGIIRGWMYSDT
ncbi:flagellar basal-body MS-ring/collar protein FliF [Telmatospirillum sp.]|uniref:flagellar basal-body MS-ring/collar protein FliF n=1 Tax=Telmatospirillum sp. TaxID=2079197 RepID=UPI00283BE03A|nr:flagellar basal-body MS-ring/collar protein FliF [Telmatospirillum sp.]MDR3440782.1 flagellar basal-body MS-ring/collar protein FliF [Telmatospirillum sp.]